MVIRRAEIRDIEDINSLLGQVLAVHNRIRPDLFRPGCKKYMDEELKAIILSEDRPIFVYEDEDRVWGYAFCEITQTKDDNILYDTRTLYIDDLCVDETMRGRHIAQKLFEHVKQFARQTGCDYITLNVWQGNDGARAFYDKQGFTPRKTYMEYKL